MEIADNWYLYDNSEGQYLPTAKKVEKNKIIINFERWEDLIRK